MVKYTVHVVDDEYYAREGIKQLIQNLGPEYVVIGESEDAFQALDFICENRPDIVLTDIHMPVMNGIELVRKAMEYVTNTKFIIITGHDEFEYAKQAMKLDIVDFILKPVDQEELDEAIRRAVKQISRDTSAVKKDLIGYLRGEHKNIPELPMLVHGEVHLALLEAEQDENHAGQFELEEFVIWLQERLRNWVQKEIKTEVNILNVHSDRFLLLLPDGVEYRPLLEGLIQDAAADYALALTAAVTNPMSVERLPEGYRLAKELLADFFYYGRGTVIEKPYQQNRNANSNNVKDQLQAVKISAQALDQRNSKRQLEQLFQLLYEMKCHYSQVMEYMMNLYFFIRQLLAAEHLDFPELEDYNPTIHNKTLQDLQGNMILLYHTGITRIRDEKSDTEDSAVKRAVAIINQKYCEDLSLEQLAGEVYLNPSYLSRKLKAELGVSFVKYIAKLRMEKAIILLRENTNLAQVAKMVGYSSQKHFSDVFKNYTGYLPSEYCKRRYAKDKD